MSREGRSLCGQTGQSHPEGWVLRQQKGKPTFFFIVKDAVECDGLISSEPGRWISERKEPTKVSGGREPGYRRSAAGPPAFRSCLTE